MLGVSRSGYYAWRERPPPSRRSREDGILAEKVREVHERSSRRTYGYPRIHAELHAELRALGAPLGAPLGVRCGRRRVARL